MIKGRKTMFEHRSNIVLRPFKYSDYAFVENPNSEPGKVLFTV